MWEVHRDQVLSDFEWTHNGKKHFLQQSYRHPSRWYVMESKTKPPRIKPQCLEDGQVPRSHDDLRGNKVATFIVYVDDLLAVGHKTVLEGFCKRMQSVWEIATPEYLAGEPDDVESIRFLGMEIETNKKTHDWTGHQQPSVMDTRVVFQSKTWILASP
eukprot:779698-Amphidinium_carterae.1